MRQVEELRQLIRVLQAVGYGSMDGEDSAAGGEGPSREGAGGQVGSLEHLLLSKARRLEHELTMARLRLSGVAGRPSCTEIFRIFCSKAPYSALSPRAWR